MESRDLQSLGEFRQQLNALDEQLIQLLARRYEICRAVAHFKLQHDVPMMQPARVEEVKARSAQLAQTHGVDPEFMRGLFSMIIDEACRLEDRIIDDGRRGRTTSSR